MMRSPSAMPTLLARPWPSGPVVVSMPAAWPYSGWPAVREPSWRKCLISSIVDVGIAGQIEQRIEQHRAVAGRQHEAVAIRPVRSRSASYFRKRVNSTVAMSAVPIGRPGWPEFAFSTASMERKRMALAIRSCFSRSVMVARRSGVVGKCLKRRLATHSSCGFRVNKMAPAKCRVAPCRGGDLGRRRALATNGSRA